MKKNYVFALNFALVWAIVLVGFVSVFPQKSIGYQTFREELRPFDFSDKFYYENGVESAFIVNRRDGKDGQSVIDTNNDSHFRNVRIISTFPAYTENGGMIYWNLYGELFKTSFREDALGHTAMEIAEFYPLYIFPSQTIQDTLRQAHLINLRDNSYFDKNHLGLSVQVLVEFTELINTEKGREEMEILIRRNGVSLDGTPIIKTAFEIEYLTRKNLVRQKMKGLDNPAETPYTIAKVIQTPEGGSIAGDAFLLNNLGLKAEEMFINNFDCLKRSGKWCDKK